MPNLSFRCGALRLLLASSSAAALLVGAGTPPALAACTVTQNGGTVATVSNSGAINCIDVENATVTGNVINTGTGVITANGAGAPNQTGITVNNSSIGGAVSNAGVIGAISRGILVEGGTNVAGGITNSGTITHINTGFPGGTGIQVLNVGTILGGISNAGTISVGGLGIAVSTVTKFGTGTSSGGITNSGTITAGSGIRTFASTFAANISNSGVIVVTGGVGIHVDPLFGAGATFAGGVVNSGAITGSGRYGILVGFGLNGGTAAVDSVGGGISNATGGRISAANGIVVGGTVSANATPTSLTIGTFASGINNAGTITAVAGAGVQVGGIAVTNATITVSAFSGGITNSGAITQSGAAIVPSGAGSIAIGAGILVGGLAKGLFGSSLTAVTVSTLAGGIANTGTIAANDSGIWVGGQTARANTQINIGSFSGGISNGGTITGTNGAGIFVGGLASGGSISIGSFTQGISNGGAISGGSGIIVGGVAGAGVSLVISTFAGGISNSGTIVGNGGAGVVIGQAFGGNNGTLAISTFLGGITNSGAILSLGLADVAVALNHVGSFGGNIVNTSGASISGALLVGNNNGPAVGVSLFSGGVTNAGSLQSSRSALVVNGVSTFTGSVVNSGRLTAVNTGVGVGTVSSFLGGITNTGTLQSASASGVVVGGLARSNATTFAIGTFAGGITNGGTIAATAGSGILVGGLVTSTVHNVAFNVSSFAGGITNSGTVAATNGVVVGGIIRSSGGFNTNVSVDVSLFSGGITNGGTISAANSGIFIGGAANTATTSIVISTFAGGISNAGVITVTNGPGIRVGATIADSAVSISTFTGGIANSGTILAGTSLTAIIVDHVGSFAGNILNAAGASIAGGIVVGSNIGPTLGISLFSGNVTNAGRISAKSSIILVNGVSTFAGNVVNSGTLIGAVSDAIGVENTSTFAGAITNSGLITNVGGGINVTNVGVFGIASAGGGIVNSRGVISAQSAGIQVNGVATFLGGITNSGTITAERGISLSSIPTFAGGISNAGQIGGSNIGIQINAGVGFAPGSHLVNSGTITGATAAIDVSAASSAVTIDQTGGLISGAIKLSANADFLNVLGGTISGNVVGAGSADTVNFLPGPGGSFTYAAPFQMTGLEFVNFNSGTVFVDGSIQATFLDVASGGTAAGIGTLAGAVFVTSGGTLMPGDAANQLGTLHITGSLTFNSNSFYSVHMTPSASSFTTVAGATTIIGGTVQVTLQQTGGYNHTYTVVTASGGRTGTFNPVVANTGAFTFNGSETLSYDANDVFLTLSGTAAQAPLTAPPGLSVNQQNVLNAINTFIASGSTLPPGFQGLFNLSGPQLANALTQLSGENAAGFFQGAFQAGNSFLGLMVNPFLDGRFGITGGFGAAMGFAAEEPQALPQAALAFASAMPVKAVPAPATFEQRFSVWGAAYGGSGRVLGDPLLGSHDTSASAAAFAAGVDYRLSPDTLLGFALAGGGTSWNVTAGLGGGSSDMFQAGAYASHHWGAAYLSGALAYNFHDVTTNRTVTVAGTDMLRARFQTNGVGARLEGGYRYATPWLGLTPYAAAQVQSIALPSYGETATAGSNQFALNFASQTATTTRTELGTWLDKQMLMQNGALLTLYGRAAWAHDFGNGPSASAIFQALPGSNFIVNGAVPARDGALVTGAAQYGLASGWSFLAKFDGEFSSTTSIYSGSGMVKKTW